MKDTMRPQSKIVLTLDTHELATYTQWAGSQHAAIDAMKRTAQRAITRQSRILDGTRAAELEQQRLAKEIEDEKNNNDDDAD